MANFSDALGLNPSVPQSTLREPVKVKYSWFDLKGKLDENLFDLGQLSQAKFNLAFTANEVLLIMMLFAMICCSILSLV